MIDHLKPIEPAATVQALCERLASEKPAQRQRFAQLCRHSMQLAEMCHEPPKAGWRRNSQRSAALHHRASG